MLMKRFAGFSLIEFAITMAVIGVLVVASMPSMSRWIQNVRIRTAAEATLNGLQLARMEAIRRNAPMSFWLVSSIDSSCALSSSSSSWVVNATNPAGACNANGVVQARSGLDGSQNVSVVSDNDAACVVFNGFGRVIEPNYCTNAISRLVFSSSSMSGSRNLEIRLTDGGSVRMCDPQVTAIDDPRRC
jgi:type IV fimbrial biogenesis protein FimT